MSKALDKIMKKPTKKFREDVLKKLALEIQKENKKKSNIPNISILQKNKTRVEKTKSYDKLSKFLSDFLELTNNDLQIDSHYDDDEITPHNFDKQIVTDGYRYFLNESLSSDEDKDKKLAIKELREIWTNSEELTKLFYILDGFANKKEIEFGVKNFFRKIKNQITNPNVLKNCFKSYLSEGEHYDKFFDNWFTNKIREVKDNMPFITGGEMDKTFLEQRIEDVEVKNDLTNEEKEQIDQLVGNSTINITYEEALQSILDSRQHKNKDSLTQEQKLKLVFNKLDKKELLYRNSLLAFIRKHQLQKLTHKKLLIINIQLGIEKEEANLLDREQLLENLLSDEFPGFTKFIKNSVNKSSARNVLLTLDKYDLNSLSEILQIKSDTKERGFHTVVQSIVNKMFPLQTVETKEAVYGTTSKNFNYTERKQKLEETKMRDLKSIGSAYGLKNTEDQEQLMSMILRYEENISKLIGKDELYKERLIEKISKITATSKENYSEWSIEELDERLAALNENYEYWEELERNRLYKKLGELVDLTLYKYKKANTWTVSKLRKTLHNLKENWETYPPVQDEIVVENQKTDYIKIQDILDSLVNDDTSNFITEELSKVLLNIAPMNSDYGVRNANGVSRKIDFNTPYMQFLIESLKSGPDQTNAELFESVAKIVVFLQIKEAKFFRKHIEMEYYLPDILATLSVSEKFPEVYDNPSVGEDIIRETTISIENNILKYVKSMAENFYYQQEPDRRRKHMTMTTTISQKTISRIKACENKDRIEGVEEDEIVYYKDNDDGKIYCFSVGELWEQFISGDVTNPDTGKDFSTAFVERFNKVYNKNLAENKFLTQYFQKKYGYSIDKLAREKDDDQRNEEKYSLKMDIDLFSLVTQDLKDLENELVDNSMKDDKQEVKDLENDKEEVKNQDDLKKEKVELKDEDICAYCKKHVLDVSLKSVILDNNESRIIKFCSYKCFEKKEDWPLYKKKKEKKILSKLPGDKKWLKEFLSTKNNSSEEKKVMEEPLSNDEKLEKKKSKKKKVVEEPLSDNEKLEKKKSKKKKVVEEPLSDDEKVEKKKSKKKKVVEEPLSDDEKVEKKKSKKKKVVEEPFSDDEKLEKKKSKKKI
jgi:hypothetical protein